MLQNEWEVDNFDELKTHQRRDLAHGVVDIKALRANGEHWRKLVDTDEDN